MISIILTVYNTEKYLEKCLFSVCSQTFTDLQIICVNDGSPDNSLNILNYFAANDHRIEVIDQENKGPGESRNIGLSKAKGDYVCFIDSDDYIAPNYIEELYNTITRNNSDIAICKSYEVDEATNNVVCNEYSVGHRIAELGMPFNFEILKKSFFEQFIGWPWDKIYRSDFLKKHELKFPKLNNTEDLPFVLGAMVLAEKIDFTPKYLIFHRINNLSSTSNKVRAKNFSVFYIAFEILKKELQKNYEYEKVRQPLINWMIIFIQWHYQSIPKQSQFELRQIILKLFELYSIKNLTLDFFYSDLLKYSVYLSFCNEKIFKGSKDSSISRYLRILNKRIINLFYKIKYYNSHKLTCFFAYQTSDYKVLFKSNLFDPIWYRNNYLKHCHTIDPCLHYLYVGWRKGNIPSRKFDGNRYLLDNCDVKNTGVNPLVHYELFGKKENRKIYEI